MGTVVCLPTAGRVCAQCFPHSKKNSITSASCQQVPEEENTVLLRQVATAVMSECNEKTKGGGADDEDATGPDACAQHSPSFLQRTFSTSGSGSGCSSGCGSGGVASGASGFGFGSRVNLFNSQLFVSAVSSASTATAHLLEGFQKKRTRVKKKEHMEQQQPQQQQQQQQQQQHEEEVQGDGEREQGSLTIVRRSSTKKGGPSASPGPPSPSALTDDEALDCVDLSTENLPAVDTPDACDKAAIRLRCLLRQLERGEISAEILQKNLHYAARVLEAVFIDETKRLADEDDELSEVQPDAVPPEVREWLASTFTRQLATTRRKADEKPKFRSVAHAIRAGIFVDRIYRRVSNTALMQFPPEVVRVLKVSGEPDLLCCDDQMMISTLDEWSFDVFALSEAASSQPVKYLGYDLLNRYGMIHKFKVPPVTLETFLSRIEEGYCRHKNPYHNNLHAADVAQTVHYMLCQTGLMNWLTDLEIFATLVAALVHDYEHTGTTNNFHVMSGTETAILYNDRAVLENHHISASFRVLREDDCNILLNLSREEYREFRTLVIDMVLATDMSFHFSQLKNMRNLLTLAEPSVDKSKALSLVLHCCDISHPAKRWDLHHRWTMLLLEEFFRQGDMERELGLPFSPLCDRNNTLVAESQIGFIEFIVEPSMAVCSDMLEAVLGPIHSSCKPGEAARESIAEEAELDRAKNGDASPQRNTPKYKIKKPWSSCLAENKKIWKEQAAKDAELRAQQQQAEASGTEE